jgi:aminopeptidase N
MSKLQRWADAQPSVKSIRRPFRAGDNLNEAFDVLSYNKGEAILRMVEGWLGPKFRASLRQYFTRHRWGNAQAEDLWAVFDQEAGGNISETLRGYIEQPGLPQVTFTRLAGDRCEVRQRRYQTMTSKAIPSQTWRVPIIIRYGGQGAERTARFLLANRAP